ncbi:hypothetical protein DPMN_024781 [Dreissena polymorpha]|uniref:Uncharacterized protein n=1 Tax=Dreissena polymorpha TaxID=45954 RepID=A0A9D4LN28_DREPO|nr:hypothetical protein DPMN_024781 [Dreissena polymorpha]
MAERKFKQTFHTQWLSCDGAVDALLQNYDALVTCMEMDSAECGDPVATGLLNFIKDYQFLYTVKPEFSGQSREMTKVTVVHR